jgi:hypothetical protein
MTEPEEAKRTLSKTYSLPKKCCGCLSPDISRRVKIRGWGFGTLYSIEVPVCERCHLRISKRNRSYYLVLMAFTLVYLLFAITNPTGPWQLTLVVYFWLYLLLLVVLSFVLHLTPLGKSKPATLKFGRLKFRNPQYERLFLDLNREKMMFKE